MLVYFVFSLLYSPGLCRYTIYSISHFRHSTYQKQGSTVRACVPLIINCFGIDRGGELRLGLTSLVLSSAIHRNLTGYTFRIACRQWMGIASSVIISDANIHSPSAGSVYTCVPNIDIIAWSHVVIYAPLPKCTTNRQVLSQ